MSKIKTVTVRQPTYDELLLEEYLRDRDEGRIQLRTIDGRWIPIKELEYDELVGVIKTTEEQREYIEHIADLPAF